jgi:uncharacterized protein YbaR (Trm112 family)
VHLELVELLRCPVPHAPSVLVAIADEVEQRYVMRGLLGCPGCGAEYEIDGGITYFDVGLRERPADALASGEGAPALIDSALSEAAMVLAAQLALRDGRSVFATVGFDATIVAAMRRIVPARMLVINPPHLGEAYATLAPSLALAPAAIIVALSLPLAANTLSGAALSAVEGERARAIVPALQANARLVARIERELPAGVRELVRDQRVWVGEREAATSPPVQLRRSHSAT